MLKRLVIVVFGVCVLNQVHAQQTVPNKDSVITAVLQSIEPDSIANYIQQLQDLNNRFALTPQQKNTALFLAEMFQSVGLTQVTLDSFLLDSVQWPSGSGNYYSEWQYNVIAQINGAEDPSKIYLMGAHYDAIVHGGGDAFGYTPGADDNASGVAAMIETARVLIEHQIVPDHSIRFVAFAGEELGLHGSDRYSQKLIENWVDVVVMLNNDMIAHKLQATGDWRLKIQKYPGTDWIETMTQTLAAAYTNLTCYSDSNAIQYSDSWPFHIRGYDAVFYQEYDFFTSLHTVSDITDSLDMDYCAEVIKVSCAMLLFNNLTESQAGIHNPNNMVINAVYPNPTQGKIQIVFETSSETPVEITVYDVMKRPVSNTLITSRTGMNNIGIDLSTQAKGLYQLVLTMKGQTSSKRIIKL